MGSSRCSARGGRRALHDWTGRHQLAMRVATSMLMTPSYTTPSRGTTLLPAGLAAVGHAGPTWRGGYARRNAIEEALGVMVGAGFAPEAADDMGRRWEIVENYSASTPAAIRSMRRWTACGDPGRLKPRPEEVAGRVQTFAFASVHSQPRAQLLRVEISRRMPRRC